MNKLQSLLQQISIVIAKEQATSREKFLRGESFNIFKVCGVNHYEVTHSAIITEFLNPKGTHGQGIAFIEAFINSINFQDFNFELIDVKVTPEMVIPNGRIDIVISNNNKQAIIIENKIYASDQWKQLKRYDDYAKDKYTNGYKLLYLTLDGHDPNDEESTKVDYTTISYKHHIVDWLIRCKQLAIDKPLIRETLNQYIQHIKKLTNTIDMENDKNNIIELLIKHPQETAMIINAQWDMEEYIVKNIIFPILERVAQKFDMHFCCDDPNNFYSRSKSAFFALIPNKSTTWHIAFEFAKGGWRDLEVGLVWNKEQRKLRKKIKLLTPLFNMGPNDIWFYGWKYVKHPNWDTAYLLDIANKSEEFEAEYENLIEDILQNIDLEEIK